MNEALQRWREYFAQESDTAFDRLVRGVIPLGGASQLSLSEILDVLFRPGNATLDAAAAGWLAKRILGPVPADTLLHRWISVLEEYFRGIAAMELPRTSEILRSQHKRIRLWLHGFYEGPDRDPEGAYLIALARAQDDQRFSSLWRCLILGEELAGRPYLGIGILGFRKMPDQHNRESSGVPDGLLRALVELADKAGTGQARWKQTMRGLFATYRRSPGYWVQRLAPLLPYYQQQSNAREWLSTLLPGIVSWRPSAEGNQVAVESVPKVPRHVVQDWIQRIQRDANLCDTPAFLTFLDQLRAYAKATGNPEYINKTLNNLSSSIVNVDRRRAALAVAFAEEALWWAPWDAYNWTSYSIALFASARKRDAIDVLWKARYRFAWNNVIHAELGRLLREAGDIDASEGVLRESATLFPNDLICRHSLIKTLVAGGRIDEAMNVSEGTLRDFPNQHISLGLLADALLEEDHPQEAYNVYRQSSDAFPTEPVFRSGLIQTLRKLGRADEARAACEKAVLEFPTNISFYTTLGDLLIDANDIGVAEISFKRALEIDRRDTYAKGGLARVMSIRSARSRDLRLRDEAKGILSNLASEGIEDAILRLRTFDEQWERATTDPANTFRRESPYQQPKALRIHENRAMPEMSNAERLGRAMITLWQAERTDDALQRSSLCVHAAALLEVSDEKIESELLAAFIETRGLVLLASGDALSALTYFEEQISHYGRGGWIGIQLGDQRARIVLGVPKDADDTVEVPNSQSARFALYVTEVIQALSTSSRESTIRDLLRALYPRAADFATRAQPDAEGGLSIRNGAEMLGTFLQTRWFRPAGIRSVEDFDRPDALRTVLGRINSTRTDAFSVISNAASESLLAV